MKKTFFAFASTLFILTACNKENIQDDNLVAEEPVSATGRCVSHEILEEQLLADPARAARLEALEDFTKGFDISSGRYASGGNIIIPVVVNVLYKTAAQNISNAQIQSQIDVLNADYAALNSDYNSTPSYFQGVRSGDTHIRFELAGIVRKATTKSSWRTDDSMKKSKKGGIDPTSPANTLNMWICNLSGGILGYAQFPGGAAATDGVVLDDNATGKTGTAAAPYGLGRTATHEVGHWLNLRHIWGDATCGNDFVNDTPLHQSSNGGCPTYPKYGSCSSSIPMQTMNYMDYTYDACMHMFTVGQSTRMNATFAGSRSGFAL
ncbi:MAG: zinc metalloprotease [Sphingobacteriales bacterium]|nr:MAG: zinc metalloprotease [Sphingobacteriales bacterium]